MLPAPLGGWFEAPEILWHGEGGLGGDQQPVEVLALGHQPPQGLAEEPEGRLGGEPDHGARPLLAGRVEEELVAALAPGGLDGGGRLPGVRR